MNTNKTGDKPEELHESFMCPKLGDHMHLSTDLIVADLLGELSPESHSKVASHIELCRECAEVCEFAKKALTSKSELDEQPTKFSSPQPLDVKTRSRIEFFAMLNAKRDQLINMILKLLFPEASELVTTSERHFLPQLGDDSKPSTKPKDHDRADAVREIVDFTLFLQDLIMERCSDVAQMEQELPKCIDDAMGVLDIAKGDKQARRKVAGMLQHFLSQDNE
jgi:hypothetical protein